MALLEGFLSGAENEAGKGLAFGGAQSASSRGTASISSLVSGLMALLFVAVVFANSDDAFGGFLFETKLAAGGVDVVALLDAEGGDDAGLLEDVLKGATVREGGAFPLEAFDGVIGDEVDFRADAAGVAGEDGGLGEGIVDSLDENIFEGEFLFFRGVPMGKGVHELGDGIFFVHRHDLGADFIGGTVEGDSEADLLGVLGELADLRGEAGGGDGEVAGAEVEGFRSGDEGDCCHEVVEVCHRLAHAHKDEAVDTLAGDLLGGEDLAGDFRGVEVPGVAGEAGGAEFAAVGAADLRGDTEGAAIRFFAVECGVCGDEDGLDVAPVVEAEKEFSGGILAALGGGVAEGGEAKGGGDFFPQGGGEVGHFIEGCDLFLPDPIEDLLGAEGGLAMSREPGGDSFRGLAGERWEVSGHSEKVKSTPLRE